MISKKHISLLGMLLTLALSMTNFGCGGGQAAPPITVFVTPPSASVAAGTTEQVTATVDDDASNAGVTWTLTQNGTPCSPSCGSISLSSTTSANGQFLAPVIYTAPATVPNPAMVTITATSVADRTKASSSTITVTPPPIAVSVSPPSATVPSVGTQQFIATVANDPSNGGVNWQVTAKLLCNIVFRCGPIVVPCSTCGTVSPASSSSGAQVTYTAPGHLTPPTKVGYHFGDVELVATSATNSGASGSATIKVLPISVSVSPTSASVALNATQQFSATVTNDVTSSGVTWTLTQNGAACSPGCGTISPATAPSGGMVTYTAPGTAPASPAVTVSATSVTDTNKPGSAIALLRGPTDSGNESLLNGQYAFELTGFDSGGSPMAIVGSFTADGTGKITGGEEDSYAAITVEADAQIDATDSLYSVGPDHRGFMALAISGSGPTYFRFALGSPNTGNVAAIGRIIEFGNATGQASQAVGTMRLQDPASFAALKGQYVLGVTGVDPSGADSLAGTFVADGVSAISSGTFDIDRPDGTASNVPALHGANFTCCSANGRGTLDLRINTTAFASSQFVFYMVSGAEAFVGTDIPINMGGGFTGCGPQKFRAGRI